MSEEIRDGKILVHIDPDVQDLVPQFLRNRAEDVRKIAELLKTKKYAEIESLAHRLKGNGEGYGFSSLTEIGEEMELAAKQRRDEGIIRAQQKLSEYLARVQVICDEAA